MCDHYDGIVHCVTCQVCRKDKDTKGAHVQSLLLCAFEGGRGKRILATFHFIRQ